MTAGEKADERAVGSKSRISLVARERYNLKAKARRDRLRAAGLCISSELHGKATHGVLCRACRLTHRGSPLAPAGAPRFWDLIQRFAATIVIDTRRRAA